MDKRLIAIDCITGFFAYSSYFKVLTIVAEFVERFTERFSSGKTRLQSYWIYTSSLRSPCRVSPNVGADLSIRA